MFIFIHVLSEINDSKDTQDRRKEKLGIFCYYKVPVLSVKKYSVI